MLNYSCFVLTTILSCNPNDGSVESTIEPENKSEFKEFQRNPIGFTGWSGDMGHMVAWGLLVLELSNEAVETENGKYGMCLGWWWSHWLYRPFWNVGPNNWKWIPIHENAWHDFYIAVPKANLYGIFAILTG